MHREMTDGALNNGESDGGSDDRHSMSRGTRRTSIECLECLDMGKKSRNNESTKTNKTTKEFLTWLELIPDPQERYQRATEELERHQRAVMRISAARARAVAEAYRAGQSVRSLAVLFGISPSRVHQLIADSKGGAPGR
jgi:DNA-directed RNA polymerase specialized sigma24 family protein